jgi:uncharacterized protein YpuA (DUF1002 family)
LGPSLFLGWYEAGIYLNIPSGNTKESEAATSGVFESTKQKLGEQYEAAKEAANEQIKVASKLAGDVGQHVKHMAGAGHEEL